MVKAAKITSMLCFCFLLACPVAQADDKLDVIMQRLEELQENVKELEGLKQEVAVLKEELKHEREGREDQIDSLQEQIEEVKPVIDIAEQLAKTDLGGYFEFHYNSNIDDKSSNTLDFHRFVLNIDHEINDWIMFRSELELEHALVQGGSDSGELELEQALLEFSLHKNFNVRAGVLLMPIGLINQHHEPTTFNGVERPFVDKYIIPTTWFESGVGIFGQVLPGLDYQLNIMSGLEAENFSAKDGLRSGRQKAYKSKSEDLALAGRLVYTNIPGFQFGTSFYLGNSAQDLSDVGDVGVAIAEADFKYTRGKFDFRGEYAMVTISDADKLNQALGKTSGKDAIAEQLKGWYLEGAYRFLHDILPATSHDANIFVRYEEFDTQHDMPSGYKANPEYDRTAWTFGLSYYPVENVVIKGDLQRVENGDGNTDELFNLGLGWHF
jgi:hypothetical protein